MNRTIIRKHNQKPRQSPSRTPQNNPNLDESSVGVLKMKCYSGDRIKAGQVEFVIDSVGDAQVGLVCIAPKSVAISKIAANSKKNLSK